MNPSSMPMVHFIGAGPGDPELITVRAKRLIETCPVVLYAGSLVPKEVVALARADARVIDTALLHLDEIIAEIEKAHAAGQDVARCIRAIPRSTARLPSRCGGSMRSAFLMTSHPAFPPSRRRRPC